MYSLFTIDHLINLRRIDEAYFSLGKILKENERKYKCFISTDVDTNLQESFYSASVFFQYEPILDRYGSILIPVHFKDERVLVLWNYHRNVGFNQDLIALLRENWRDIGAGLNYIVWTLNQSSADGSVIL
jgi:hypothetical protein